MKILKNLFGKSDTKIDANEIAVEGNLLGNAVIVESGSNTNGKYVKFGDGTMICTHYMITEPTPINLADGALFKSNDLRWDYPAIFVGNRPAISINNNNTTSPNFGVSKTIDLNWLVFFLYRSTSLSAVSRHISLMAIGRWK